MADYKIKLTSSQVYRAILNNHITKANKMTQLNQEKLYTSNNHIRTEQLKIRRKKKISLYTNNPLMANRIKESLRHLMI
jgi:hypothetical protein